MARPGRPAIGDVAARAGVSAATVSRALRGVGNVQPDTAARVRQAAEELGYIASPVAASLATGSTRTIALLCSQATAWFVAHVSEAIMRAAREEGFSTLVFTLGMGAYDGHYASSRLPVNSQLLAGRADAVIVVGVPLDAGEVAELQTLGVPLVFVGPAQPGLPSVHIDERATAHAAVSHLLTQGHRVIGHVTGPAADTEVGPPYLRLRGYAEALQAAGIGVDYDLIAHCDYTRESARQACRDLLRTRPDTTAILGFSDVQAAGALAAVADVGRAVPDDVAVMGIDGSLLAEALSMTTMAQPVVQQGEVAVSLALEALTGGPVPEDVVFDTTLLVRETA